MVETHQKSMLQAEGMDVTAMGLRVRSQSMELLDN